MVIFLYGPDAYRIKQARENIIKEYGKKHPSGVNLMYFDYRENPDTKNLLEFVRGSSFFDEHRLAVLSGSFLKKTVSEKILKIIQEHDLVKATDITLLFTEPDSEKELKAKDKDLFKIVSGGIVKTFGLLEGQALHTWIREEISVRGCRISKNALTRLVDAAGNDSWLLMNEIEKLTSYKKGGEITDGDIDELVFSSEDLNIFNLTDAITSGNKSISTQLLHLNLASGKDPYHLFSLIVGQFRNMLMVKELAEKNESQSSVATKAGLHPFVVKKIFQNSKFDMIKLREKYKKLLNIDTGFKDGRSNLTDSLYEFVSS